MFCLCLGANGGCDRSYEERDVSNDGRDSGLSDAGDSPNDKNNHNRPDLIDASNLDFDAFLPPPPPEDAAPGECGASSFEATQVVIEKEVQVESQIETVKPVVLYVLFDKSLSMSGNWPIGSTNLWDPAVKAMKQFVNDPDSSDIGIGLQYFPISSGKCSGAGYRTPAVSVGQLPGHAEAISDSLDAHDPDGSGTPIEGALRGVTDFCKQYQASHEGVQCVSVLVTDGKPELDGCEHDTAKLAAIAKAANDAGVTTFAVGLKGADFGLLDEIARKGGAPDCDTASSAYACNVSSGASKLADALTSIRDTVVTTEVHTEIVTTIESTALPCEWQIPEPPDGKVFDRDKVNIRLTHSAGETTLGRVGSADACEGAGWHFDDFEAPTRMIACPAACERIEAEPEARIDVLLGCETVVEEPQFPE